MFLGRGDDIIKTLQAIGTGVDGGAAARKMLEPDGAGGGDRVDIVESPDAQNAQPRGAQVLHDQVDVGIVGQEANPVRVGSGKVARLAIDGEVETVGVSEAGGG